MTDTVDDWIGKMSCRIINAYTHDCRIANSAGRKEAKNKHAMDIFNKLSIELYFMTDTVIDDWIGNSCYAGS